MHKALTGIIFPALSFLFITGTSNQAIAQKAEIEKRLYKVKFYNTAPFKLKGFTVAKLDMTVELMPDSDGKTILIKDETIIMDMRR